jgi:molybdate transport system substrate-binding protein
MISRGSRPLFSLISVLILSLSSMARADSALVAVSANFVPAVVELAREFEADSGHDLQLAAGSTGKLYAQIVNGAPFDVFLAADQARPARLETEGRIVPGSRFTYALGRLVIWIPERITDDEDPQQAIARLANVRRLALANPELAPYGAAAMEVLQRFDLVSELDGRIVRGENVAQAYAMVASGAADAGLIALSHVLTGNPAGEAATHWLAIPADWHAPIRQDAVLLEHGRGNAAAAAFLAFLKRDSSRVRLQSLGFDS